MNRTFEGIETAIQAHADFNNVSADYTPEQLAERTAEIFSGLAGRQLDLSQGAPSPKF